MAKRKKCPECGKRVSADNGHCPSCGAEVRSSDRKGKARTAKQESGGARARADDARAKPKRRSRGRKSVAQMSRTRGQGALGLAPPPLHAVCETHAVATRLRLLQRLRARLDSKDRDPEMLYLGARYAASLGLQQEAQQFLDPLAEMLRDENGPAPAYLPVAILYHHLLPPGEDRDAKLQGLEELCASSEQLAETLRLVGLHPNDPAPSGSPQQVLQDVESRCDEDTEALLLASENVASPEEVSACLPVRIRALAHKAAESYAADSYLAGDLSAARAALETILTHDGDQPDALRNLITVASEQQDIEAYERYWRRYVTLLLWRLIRGDATTRAYADLVRFYVWVAQATDQEFGEQSAKVVEILRRPGLLPRWLEAHAALIWLDSARRAHRQHLTGLGLEQMAEGRLGHLAVMRFWLRVFYPAFHPYLDTDSDTDEQWDLPPGPLEPALPFDPAERLLTRFAEWANPHMFGLRSDQDDHAQTVSALAGFVARVPTQRYAKELADKLQTDPTRPVPVHQALQEACSLPLGFHLREFLGDGQWRPLVEFYGDPDVTDKLSAQLRLFLACGHCRLDQSERGLHIACQALPDARPSDFDEDSQSRLLIKEILHANVARIFSEREADREAKLSALKQEIEAIPEPDLAAEFKAACRADLAEAEERRREHARIEQTVKEVQRLAGARRFDEARDAVLGLPDEPQELAQLKQNLTQQLDGAEEAARLHDRVERAVKRARRLVEEGDFREARHVISGLPDQPSDLRDLKRNLERQINEAQEHARTQARIEETIEESRKLVKRDDFDGARALISDLPDSPSELRDLKQNLHSQIDEAEEASEVHRRVEEAVEKSKTLVGRGKFSEARKVIRGLPSHPPELRKLQGNLLKQIDDAEEGASVQVRVEKAVEQSRDLVKRGKFSEARRIIRALPSRPSDLQKLKDDLLKQIDEAEEMSRLRGKIDSTIEESKRLVGRGSFDEARRVIRNLPSSPNEMRQLKDNLLGQIDEVEKQAGNLPAENLELMRKLERRGISGAKIAAIANANNVDMTNAFEMNALLKAIDQQL